MAHYVVRPLPPKTVIMTTGAEGLSYMGYGERYNEILARSDVRLKLIDSSGSVENCDRLRDSSFAVDVGFVEGGVVVVDVKDGQAVVGLGRVVR